MVLYSTKQVAPSKVAIIGASGTYGRGIYARAQDLGIGVVVVTRSPDKFKDAKDTTTVAHVELTDEDGLVQAFEGCDGVITALSPDAKKPHLPTVWRAMKTAGVTKYVGVDGAASIRGKEKVQFSRRMVHTIMSVFAKEALRANDFEEASLRLGSNDADGLDYILTRPARPCDSPFVGAGIRKDETISSKTSIYDHGDFCLYAVAVDTSDSSDFVQKLGRYPIVSGTEA